MRRHPGPYLDLTKAPPMNWVHRRIKGGLELADHCGPVIIRVLDLCYKGGLHCDIQGIDVVVRYRRGSE